MDQLLHVYRTLFFFLILGSVSQISCLGPSLLFYDEKRVAFVVVVIFLKIPSSIYYKIRTEPLINNLGYAFLHMGLRNMHMHNDFQAYTK